MRQGEFAVRHWLEMRRHAIEVGLIAERNLIALGELDETDRRISTRAEQRRNCLTVLEPVKVDMPS